MKRLCMIWLALSLVGCEQYVENDSSPLEVMDREYVLAIVLDTSGSFTQTMFDGNQPGYEFFLRSSDKFFRDRFGENDRILISQLSAENRTLLWEGRPLSLRRQFGSADSLRQFIEQRSNPGGSRAYAAVADTLDYLHHLPGVQEGKTKVCVLVLSDMLDNSPTQQADKQRMTDSLRQFEQTGGCIGLYWVDQQRLGDCRDCLAAAGLDGSRARVECGIVNDPKLPNFE